MIKRRNDVRESESVDDAEEPDDDSEKVDGADEAELTDAQRARVAEVFQYLQARQQSFSDAYPFRIDEDGQLVLLDETSPRSFYLFLLFSSCLRYVVDAKAAARLPAEFEGVCLAALREIMPKRAEVHLFGKNSYIPNPRYKGLLTKKLELLVTDLGEEKRFSDKHFATNDTGDNGLDLIAWTPMGDALNGRLIVFGQCAATAEWVGKQHTSSPDAWRGIMSQLSDHTNMCFIPFDFRRHDGSWYKEPSIHNAVVVDRRRILDLTGVLVGGHASETAAAAWAENLLYPAINNNRATAKADL
ncbi:hypothetical protein [Nocardioides sp. SYSU D00038]|uniref:hypothetical protein n=1 Tax=Nocardioides sp. SYSU D00038 TaxID=2812554 RepID=UPI001968709F|nr:hypothetical protein [Nocardioides sp. SYSU D00038]